ncbi:hypothetical protein [Erwinia sp. E_sp_B04_7]|uniref:hypothetical protein n=1 Tax=unclassified Erwinia TaxID=2622719 RepID=UPI0030D37498
MHPESIFLSQFKSIAQQTGAEPREKINELAILLSENNAFLDDSSETVEMINSLSDSIENDFSPASLLSLKPGLFNFWKKLLLSKKMDVFFIGSEEHASYFFEMLDKESLGDIFYIKVEKGQKINVESFLQPLNNSSHPVIVYDHGAESVRELVETKHVVLMADFQQVMMLKALPFSDRQDALISFLQHKHNQTLAKKSPTLIMGSSYGYYAFPQQCLNKAVNLSMHSLDLRQAQAMMNHYASNKKTKTIVLMSGYFDLFYELYKTHDQDNILALHILNHYNHKNDITPCNAITADFLTGSDEALLAYFLPVIKNNARLTAFYRVLDNVDSLKRVSENLEGQIVDASSMEPSLYVETSKARALRHSKSYKYKSSKEVNETLLREMCDVAREKGIRIHYVIPPFPQAYMQGIEPGMVAESRAFLKSLENYHFTLHDFNEDKPFNRTEFRDGDHLNYHGAVKVVKALKKKGLML